MRERLPKVGPLTIRAAVVVGFGLTLMLWLSTGYYFSQRLARVEKQAATLSERYLHSQDLLSNVRAQVLLGSVYVRDALLDPTPGSADDYRRQMQQAYEAAISALKQYEPIDGSAAEAERLARLSRELDEFRGTLFQLLATDSSQWATNARTLLREWIVPKREVVIRVSEEVQGLNRAAFVQQQSAIAAIYTDMEHRLWQTLGLALALSLGIALIATMYASRLEARVERQREQEAQNTRDLQRLSAKLVSVQEDERRAIARELHDEVGQVLTAIKVELGFADNKIDPTSKHLLEDARLITDRAIQTVRALTHLLHPALLDDFGLPAAIEAHLCPVGERHGMRMEVLHEGMDKRLTPETEAAAYRIVQEALTNVIRHARASTCRVFLQRLPHTLLVTVDDDGVGFDVNAIHEDGGSPGLGIIGIRERVAQLSGTLRLESTPGKGTRLTVELPTSLRASPRRVDWAQPAGSETNSPAAHV